MVGKPKAPDTSRQDAALEAQMKAEKQRDEELRKKQASQIRATTGSGGTRSLLSGSETGLRKQLG